MKKLNSLLFLVFLAASAFGQTLDPITTLSAAVTSASTQTVTVTSTTGITAPGPNGASQTFIFVDGELMDVRAVSGTRLQVVRGASGTVAAPHLSGSMVFAGPGATPSGPFNSYNPNGSCTRANIGYLPWINTRATSFSDCIGGKWQTGSGSSDGFFRVLAPNPGAVALSTINTAGTTLSATTMYCNEIDLPGSNYLTGLGVLNGSTVGTDNHLVALYDSAGNLLASSAAAGVLAAGASTYQTISFVTPYFAVGPAQYFGCLQTNGTTATVRMEVTGVNDTYLTKGVTGQTFGTVPATIVVPTTFTTAVGPYLTAF